MINKEMLAENKQKCLERAEKHPQTAVVPEGTCPVQWAIELVKNARADACGKSVMCRDGLWQLQLMLEGIATGQSNSEDLDVMKELLVAMKTIGCPNTQKVASLVIDLMDQNPDEWNLHVGRKRCTTLSCYYNLYIDPATCNGCGACKNVAPADAVAGGEGMIHVIKDEAAVKNAEFVASCPVGAIKKYGAVKPACPAEPMAVGTFGAAAGGAAGGRRRRRG